MPTVFFLILVSAKKEYEKLIVEFKGHVKTKCIGFIVSVGKIASTNVCGTQYMHTRQETWMLPLVPYCNGIPVKIKGNPLIIEEKDLSFFTVGL